MRMNISGLSRVEMRAAVAALGPVEVKWRYGARLLGWDGKALVWRYGASTLDSVESARRFLEVLWRYQIAYDTSAGTEVWAAVTEGDWALAEEIAAKLQAKFADSRNRSAYGSSSGAVWARRDRVPRMLPNGRAGRWQR